MGGVLFSLAKKANILSAFEPLYRNNHNTVNDDKIRRENKYNILAMSSSVTPFSAENMDTVLLQTQERNWVHLVYCFLSQLGALGMDWP